MSQLQFFAPPSDPFAFLDETEPAPQGDPLRWYQDEAVREVLRLKVQGHKTALTVLATGLGKTEIFCELARVWDGPVLVLAHRDELVQQARARLERRTGELVEIEQADFTASQKARIVVGSVQTVTQRPRMERLGKGRFSLIITDECHHFLAPTFRRPLEYFDYDFLLGATATPNRGDEKALGQLYEHVAYCMDVNDGIDGGYLVPIRGQTVIVTDIQIDGVDKVAGDLVAAQLDQAMLKSVEGIVKETLRLEPHRRAIGFFPGVATAELACQRFNAEQPNSTAFLSGKTPELERKRIMADFKAGKYKRMMNCMLFTEGLDVPDVSLIIQARPTMSLPLLAQMVGRGTRTLPGTVDRMPLKEQAEARRAAVSASGKPDCMVLDFIGNASKYAEALMTPEDLLGGDYTEEEVKLAKREKKNHPGEDALAMLKAARAAIAEQARKVQSRVQSEVRPFDPFNVFGWKYSDREKASKRFGTEPATPAQLEVLVQKRVEACDLRGLTRAAAEKLLAEIRRREKYRLASYRQLRQLQKFGITDRDITARRAKEAVYYISAQLGWFGAKPLGPVDPKRLREIVGRMREPGEEG